MKDHSQSQTEEAELDLTPMLDVVFIMLIFFIVTAVFVKEAGQTVDKPLASMADPRPRASILIAVTANDQIWLNRKQVDLKAVRPLIERLHSENPLGTVVIQADRQAKSGLTLQVMQAAQDAGVPEVSVSALVP